MRRIKGKGAGVNRPRILKVFVNAIGYAQTIVMRNGKPYKPGTHVLIAAAFLGECPPGHEVNHIDMNKLNNHPENLEYVTHAENLQRARKAKSWGTCSKGRALTDDQVRDIRNSSLSQRVLGARYGVSGVAIFHIRHRDTYKQVTDF